MKLINADWPDPNPLSISLSAPSLHPVVGWADVSLSPPA